MNNRMTHEMETGAEEGALGLGMSTLTYHHGPRFLA